MLGSGGSLGAEGRSPYLARETVTPVWHPLLGPHKMQNVIPRLGATPGRIDGCGPELGKHNEEILRGRLGLGEAELAGPRRDGVIASAPDALPEGGEPPR